MEENELRQALGEGKIPRIKAAIKSEKEPVLAAFRRGEISGRELTRQLSDVTDRQVRIFAEHYLSAYKDRIALVYTGGNGRQEVHPYSDLDLLTLVPEPLPEGFEEAYSQFYLAVLDAGFTKPGLAVRTPAECPEKAKEDHTIWTSMLDRRYLWGERTLADELDKEMSGLQAGAGKRFLADKLAERGIRIGKMGESRYMLHPNVKEGKGSLRDYQTVMWIAGTVLGCEDLADIADYALLSPAEQHRIEEAHEFLMTVRSHLHDTLGGPGEQLTAEVLPELVARYNASRPGLEPETIESFMRQYFSHTREIGFFANIVGAAAGDHERWLAVRWTEEDEFQTGNGHIRFKTGAAPDPAAMMRIFYVADKNGYQLHHSALRTIRTHAKTLGDDMRQDPTVNQLFIDVLSDCKDSSGLLRQMQETGLLQQFIPGFANIDMLMQFDPYHEYTVDEHTFHCLQKMHALEAGDLADEAPLATKSFKGLSESDRRVLYTAMMLHDICKGQGGRHEERGAAYAAEICPRLGLSAEETQTVSWLVAQHLLLSYTAFHRDPHDPATIENFAAAIPSEKHLDLLSILTTADIMGVGPGRWNWNKAASIQQLYDNAELFIREKELRSAPESSLPENYEPGKTVIDIRNDPLRRVTTVTVITPDRAALFEKLTGAISLGGGNIIDARIHTTGHEPPVAIDSFTIRNAAGNVYEEWDFDRLRARIAAVLDGSADPEKEISRLKGPTKKYRAYAVTPEVRFNNAASHAHTVLEIEARDRPELLYELSKIFNNHELDLRRAKVTVYGHKAIDTFYLRDKETGGKVDPARFETIREAIAASPAFRAG